MGGEGDGGKEGREEREVASGDLQIHIRQQENKEVNVGQQTHERIQERKRWIERILTGL